MKNLIFCGLIVTGLFTASCSKLITVNFAHESPDVTPSDQSFYGRVKTFSVKTSNQSVVYSQEELSQQSMNILINSIEKGLVSQGFKSTRKNPDIEIEVIAVKNRPYTTNIGTKKNGRQEVFPCHFMFEGPSVFVRVNKEDKAVDYTFYSTPCENGCTFKIGKDCKQTPAITIKDDHLKPIIINAKDNPLAAEVIGETVAVYLTERIKESK